MRGGRSAADPHEESAEAPAADFAADGPAEPPPCYDGWEMGEQLRDIQRALRTAKPKDRQSEAIYRRESARFDLPHAEVPALHVPAANPPHQTAEPGRRPARLRPGRGHLARLGAGHHRLRLRRHPVGLVARDRPAGAVEHRPAGGPGRPDRALVGLVLQLDRLWRDSREAAAKLDGVDEQLHELKATTTLLGTAQGPAATTFYSHFAGGASPQLLLTDLKSQIDLLAMKIAQDERAYLHTRLGLRSWSSSDGGFPPGRANGDTRHSRRPSCSPRRGPNATSH